MFFKITSNDLTTNAVFKMIPKDILRSCLHLMPNESADPCKFHSVNL